MSSIEERLQSPFTADDIEWRVQQAGVSAKGKPYAMVLAYVTNRAIQSRLDDVFGVFGWKNIYNDMDGKAVECGISVYNPTTCEWVTKYDAADQTDIEGTKGGRSNAMKRAAVQLGIGRYLYKLDATFADCSDDAYKFPHRQTFKPKSGQPIYGSWKTPLLPDWALPKLKKTEEQKKEEFSGAMSDGKISKADVEWVKKSIKDYGINETAFMQWLSKFRCNSIEDITSSFFVDVKAQIEAKGRK